MRWGPVNSVTREVPWENLPLWSDSSGFSGWRRRGDFLPLGACSSLQASQSSGPCGDERSLTWVWSSPINGWVMGYCEPIDYLPICPRPWDTKHSLCHGKKYSLLQCDSKAIGWRDNIFILEAQCTKLRDSTHQLASLHTHMPTAWLTHWPPGTQDLGCFALGCCQAPTRDPGYFALATTTTQPVPCGSLSDLKSL